MLYLVEIQHFEDLKGGQYIRYKERKREKKKLDIQEETRSSIRRHKRKGDNIKDMSQAWY